MSTTEQLTQLVEKAVKNLRGFAAAKGVENESDAKAALRRMGPKMPVALVSAKGIALKGVGPTHLYQRLLPPFTEDEVRIGRNIDEAIKKAAGSRKVVRKR